jgi:AraC-like DNA-binding protein
MESIFLEKLLADIDRSPSPLQRFLQFSSPERFHQSLRETTPLMQQTLHQLVGCPYQGVLQQIYLEGKTLELLVLQMACWSEQLEMQVRTRLQPKDIELIHQAGAFLKENWTDPPSLFKLARQVGLNDFKLKQGFRQVFGTTVFGYLQAYRMEQARQLLWDRHVSVAGVARAIGYVSPSAFSAAFRRHFGSSPKTFRQPE